MKKCSKRLHGEMRGTNMRKPRKTKENYESKGSKSKMSQIRYWQTTAHGPNPVTMFFYNQGIIETQTHSSFTYYLWLLSCYNGPQKLTKTAPAAQKLTFEQ